MQKSKSKQRSLLKFQVAVLIIIIVVPTSILLYMVTTRRIAARFLAVRGTVFEVVTNETQTPLFNVTVVAVTDMTNFAKSFTNETGHYEIWIKYPENLSIPVMIYVSKENYVDVLEFSGWRNLGTRMRMIDQTPAYEVWGYVSFSPFFLVKIEDDLDGPI